MKRWFLLLVAIFSVGTRPSLAEGPSMPALLAAAPMAAANAQSAATVAPVAAPAAYETYQAIEGVMNLILHGDPNWKGYYLGVGLMAWALVKIPAMGKDLWNGTVSGITAARLSRHLKEGDQLLKSWGEYGDRLAERLTPKSQELANSFRDLRAHLASYPSGLPYRSLVRSTDWIGALDKLEEPTVKEAIEKNRHGGKPWMEKLATLKENHHRIATEIVDEFKPELHKLQAYYRTGNRIATNGRSSDPVILQQEAHYAIRPVNNGLGGFKFKNPAGKVERIERPDDIPDLAGQIASNCQSRMSLLRGRMLGHATAAKNKAFLAAGLVATGVGGYLLKEHSSSNIEKENGLKPEVIISQAKEQARQQERQQERQEIFQAQEPLELVGKLKDLRDGPDGAEMAAIYGVLRESVKGHLTDLAVDVQKQHQASALTGADFWPRFVKAQAEPEFLNAILDKALASAARSADFNFTDPDRIALALKGQLPGNGETERQFLIAVHNHLPKQLWPLLYPPGTESPRVTETVTKKFVEKTKVDLEKWRAQTPQQTKVATAPTVPAPAVPTLKP